MRSLPFLRLSKKFLSVTMLMVLGCVEPYAPPEVSGDPDIIVIDGFLNAGDNSCRVKVTRAVPISSQVGFENVQDSPANPITVTLEEEEGTSFPLTRIATGTFEALSLPIDPQRKYRLVVTVPPAQIYVSDYTEVKITPGIEKVFFDYNDDGLRILVNSENSNGDTKYYRWSFTETFEHTSNYSSSYIIDNGEVVTRAANQLIYRCFRTDESKNILIANSTELESDVIQNFHIQSIPRSSQKLQIRYSINVRQYSLTEDAYTFWLNLYKTTENVGGLFDPMPGEVHGNFRSTSDPGRTVIGYFSSATMQEKRLFITPEDLPDGYVGFRHPQCPIDTILLNQISSFDASKLLVSAVYSTGGIPEIIGYSTSEPHCVDCRRLHGGVTDIPPFWP
jgi:hypothetical protein